MSKAWIYYCSSEEELLQKSQEDLELAIHETLKKYPDCRLGLAGGSTPKALYEKLAGADLPWEKIKIIQLDERYVPSDDKESNLKMLRQTLLSHAPVPPENVFVFDTSLSYESAAEEMTRQLEKLGSDRALLDVLVLGAGSDGHIASLFEGDSALQSTELASTATAEGYPTPQRLTLTLPALAHARALLLLKGPEKAAVIGAIEGKLSYPLLTAFKELSKTATVKVLAYV